MKIALNKAHFPVTVLGPGRRIGLWMQGCSIRCKGCLSKDTWERDPGREMRVARLLTWCREATGGDLDGVTITGGEPFDQPKALAALLQALACWRQEIGRDFDILCYSGYPLATIQKRHARLLQGIDAIIPEPFVEALPQSHLWRGSANQPLVPLSERGCVRYAPWLEAMAEAESKRIQTVIDGQHVWVAGIPARGDLEALEALCRQRGLPFGEVSWR